MCQKRVLRQSQHLPDETAGPSLYLLTGLLPVEAIIDRNILVFLCNILRNTGTKEKEILRRQMSTKNLSSNSWVNTARSTLRKYDLPTIYELEYNHPDKMTWKRQVKVAVEGY